MNKIVSSKITVLTFGILVISFAIAFYVVAWQEPGQTPPGGNVPAPLNVGSTGQSKAGGLILNTGGAVNGLIIDKGNLCLGTDCRSKWPETGVLTTYEMSAKGYNVGDKYYAKTVSFDCPAGVPILISRSSLMICCYPPWGAEHDACSYSINGNKATLTAYVVETYDTGGGTYASPVSYCYPHTGGTTWSPVRYKCYIPGSCSMQFQCNLKQTVGQ